MDYLKKKKNLYELDEIGFSFARETENAKNNYFCKKCSDSINYNYQSKFKNKFDKKPIEPKNLLPARSPSLSPLPSFQPIRRNTMEQPINDVTLSSVIEIFGNNGIKLERRRSVRIMKRQAVGRLDEF